MALAVLNLFSVLRIRDVYAGSDFSHPGSRIDIDTISYPDPHQHNFIIFNPEKSKIGKPKVSNSDEDSKVIYSIL